MLNVRVHLPFPRRFLFVETERHVGVSNPSWRPKHLAIQKGAGVWEMDTTATQWSWKCHWHILGHWFDSSFLTQKSWNIKMTPMPKAHHLLKLERWTLNHILTHLIIWEMLKDCLAGLSYSSLAIIVTIYCTNCILQLTTHVSNKRQLDTLIGKYGKASFHFWHMLPWEQSVHSTMEYSSIYTKKDEQPKATKNCKCIGNGRYFHLALS